MGRGLHVRTYIHYFVREHANAYKCTMCCRRLTDTHAPTSLPSPDPRPQHTRRRRKTRRRRPRRPCCSTPTRWTWAPSARRFGRPSPSWRPWRTTSRAPTSSTTPCACVRPSVRVCVCSICGYGMVWYVCVCVLGLLWLCLIFVGTNIGSPEALVVFAPPSLVVVAVPYRIVSPPPPQPLSIHHPNLYIRCSPATAAAPSRTASRPTRPSSAPASAAPPCGSTASKTTPPASTSRAWVVL